MSRAVRRLTTAAALSPLLTLAMTAPALADDIVGNREGAEPDPTSPGMTLLLYVLIPVGSVLLLAALVLLPGAVRAHRYRPAEGWSADPVWFAGPVDPEAAIASADAGDMVRGGARGSW